MKILQSENFIKTPQVSVIILTYNQEETIAHAIDNILNQQCDFNFEVIIGEDSSSDKTRDICMEYQIKFPHIIKLLLFTNNVGVVYNYLSCIKECKGRYFATCDGDDYWHNPLKLQLQVEYMETHPECGVLHTDYDELNVYTNKYIHSYVKRQKKQIRQGYVQSEIFKGLLLICSSTVCIRKEIFDQYIPVDQYIDLKFTIEDWPTWIILSKYSKVNYLPISTATYRVGHSSLSNPGTYDEIKKRFERERLMYKYLCNLFPEDLHYVEKDYDRYINQVLIGLAFKKNDFKSAKEFGRFLITQGDTSFKVKCSLNFMWFYAYCMLKKIVYRITQIFVVTNLCYIFQYGG